MENQVESRKAELENALEKVGLSLRFDSKLCYCFINGQTGSEWTVESVVQECCLMHWLYNHTNYPKRCEHACNMESQLRYFNNRRQFLSFMRKNIFPQIKDSIIKENNGLPSQWPWLVSKPIPTEDIKVETTNE